MSGSSGGSDKDATRSGWRRVVDGVDKAVDFVSLWPVSVFHPIGRLVRSVMKLPADATNDDENEGWFWKRRRSGTPVDGEGDG